MPDHPPVSSITLTYNEEDNIGDCLDSVSWCDEHIVIDEFSTDATVETAEEYGAKVVERSTPADANTFDILRKDAIEEASNDWILQIDADERIPDTLRDRVRELIGNPYIDIIRAPRKNYLGEQWITTGPHWWPDLTPLVFHRDSIEVQDRVHGFLVPTDDSRVIDLPENEECAIEHYCYSSVKDMAKRQWRYAKMEAELTSFPLVWAILNMFQNFTGAYLVEAGFQQGLNGLFVAMIEGSYPMVVWMNQFRQ